MHAWSLLGLLSRVTGPLDSYLRSTAETICAKSFTDDVWDQVTLPGPLSGCGLRLPSAMQDAALWSSWATHEATARDISDALQRPSVHQEVDQDAAAAAAALAEAGVVVRLHHHPMLTEEAQLELAATPWGEDSIQEAPDRPVRQLGSTLRLLERRRIGRLWERSSAPDRTRLLSAGGPQTGMLWTALPDPGQKQIPDEHWRVATADRLGLLRCPAGVPCGLPRGAKHGGICGKLWIAASGTSGTAAQASRACAFTMPWLARSHGNSVLQVAMSTSSERCRRWRLSTVTAP